MSKIAIYKPFKTIFFHNTNDDYAGWSIEVTAFAKILADNHNDVYILSDTDLIDNQYNNIRKSSLSANDTFDRIFMFSGTIDNAEKNIIETLRKRTNQLDFIWTDYKLQPSRFDLFDNIYTQSPELFNIKNIITKYNGLETVVLYNFKFSDIQTIIRNKTIEYYFGGNERDRLTDFVEYVWRPNCKLHCKSLFFNIDNRIGYSEYLTTLQKAKYTVLFGDVAFNSVNWLTQRYYVNIMNDVLTFIDVKYDGHCHMIAKNDWRRVHNYTEMMDKIKMLESNPCYYLNALLEQRKEMQQQFVNGSYIINKIND